MDECREAFEKWAKSYGMDLEIMEGTDCYAYCQEEWNGWYASWNTRKDDTIRRAYAEGVAWAIGTGMDIEEYLEARKDA